MSRTTRAAGVSATLLALFCSVLSGCASQQEPEPLPPVVARDAALSDAAAERLLDQALREYADDTEVRELVDAVRAHSRAPLMAGNSVSALVDGPQTFAAIKQAIETARHHVHVETFIFGDDELGTQIASLLARKRAEGVIVRVLYDSIGSMETSDDFFERMRQEGIEVREYRPMNPVKTPLLWKIQNRDHRKIIVVDGVVGFTGGINISGTYSSSSASRPGPKRGIEDGWRDTHLRIEGPVVAQLQRLFFETWDRAGEMTSFEDDAYLPQMEPRGKHLIVVVDNDSEDSDRSLYATYLAAFEQASSRLWITHAYFAPNDELLDAMTAAAKRGVDVRLIVPGFSDSNIVLHASRSTYSRLLKGGVQIFERRDALLHAKSVVVDGALSIVGSANLDMRSFVHNDEVNAIVISRSFGSRMEEIFARDQSAARVVTMDEWQRRPLWQRFIELGSKAVWYWL